MHMTEAAEFGLDYSTALWICASKRHATGSLLVADAVPDTLP